MVMRVCVCERERDTYTFHTYSMCESKRACQALQCGVRAQLILMVNINIITLSKHVCVSAVVDCPGFCSHVKDSKAFIVRCCTNSTLETVSKFCHRRQQQLEGLVLTLFLWSSALL